MVVVLEVFIQLAPAVFLWLTGDLMDPNGKIAGTPFSAKGKWSER